MPEFFMKVNNQPRFYILLVSGNSYFYYETCNKLPSAPVESYKGRESF